MSDHLLIEFAGTVLALTREEFETARTRAATLLPQTTTANPSIASTEQALTAEQMAAQMGVSPRLLEDLVRMAPDGSGIPFHRIGERAVRFVPSEVIAWSRVKTAEMHPTVANRNGMSASLPTDWPSGNGKSRLARQ